MTSLPPQYRPTPFAGQRLSSWITQAYLRVTERLLVGFLGWFPGIFEHNHGYFTEEAGL